MDAGMSVLGGYTLLLDLVHDASIISRVAQGQT